MSHIALVYYSGYGHTEKVAQTLAHAAQATLVKIDAEGHIADADWAILNNAKTIIMGSPTYMGSVSWQFKKFADATSKAWFTGAWRDKLFAGFTVSSSLNGDKHSTLQYLHLLAMQHGGLWMSLGIPPANQKASTRDDLNHLGASMGLLVQCAADAPADEIPAGDLATATAFGTRIAAMTNKFN